MPQLSQAVPAAMSQVDRRHMRTRLKCHRSIREKGTVTKDKSLFVGRLKISSKKSSHSKNAESFLSQKFNDPRLCRFPVRGGTPLCGPCRYFLL